MLFFPRLSSAFASTSQCRGAPPLPPQPATALCHPRALSTSLEAPHRPRVQSFILWELIPTVKPPPLPSPASSPSLPVSHSQPPEEESTSWEVIDEDTSAPTPNHPSLRSFSDSFAFAEITDPDNVLIPDPEHTSLSKFDTEAFPPHTHLFPLSPNGTWRNESLYALTHPAAVDYTALCTKLRLLAEEASDEFSARVNRALEGSDVPAMHEKVLNITPSVSIPNIRDFERAVNAVCECGCGLLERRRTRSRGRGW